MVENNGESGLSLALNQLMNEENFYQWLMEAFNEQLLTDKYLSSNQYEGGINLLDPDDYPQRKWYNDAYPADEQSSIRGCVRTLTNDAVAREPLAFVRYAAKQPATYSVPERRLHNGELVQPTSLRRRAT